MKALEIIKPFKTEEEAQYLAALKSSSSMAKLTAMYLEPVIKKLAQRVLNGECLHRRKIIGYETVISYPREWLAIKSEVPITTKCEFCGE